MAVKETLDYLPARRTDEAGDPIGPAPEPVRVVGVVAWPRTSVETGTEVIIEGYGLKLPASAPALNATGRILFRGKTWEIDGVPGFFPRKGYIVYLKRVGS